MATDQVMVKNTNLVKLIEDIKQLKGTLAPNQSLIFYYDTETEGLAYGQTQLDGAMKQDPSRDRQLDKIIEIGGVVAIKTENEDGTYDIAPTKLGFRNFFNPNLDRDKNKQRKMDSLLVDEVHGTSFEVLEGKENIKGTNQRLSKPSPSLHETPTGSDKTYLELTIELLNLAEDTRAHNATFDLGMINAAVADQNEIYRLNNNKTIDVRLEPLKDELKVALEELEFALEDNLPDDELEGFKNNKKDIEAKMESVKTPQKTGVLRSMQTDTMGIYKKYLPLAMQTYLNTQGVGHNNVDNNFKQDMAMDLAELEQRELHGARADAEALAAADSFVQKEIINAEIIKLKKIEELNYISKTTQNPDFVNIWQYAGALTDRLPTADKLFDKLSPEIHKPNLRTRSMVETSLPELKSAIQYALELEREIFEKAESLEEYNSMIDKKMSQSSIPSAIKKTLDDEPKIGAVKIALEQARIHFNEDLKTNFSKQEYTPSNFVAPELDKSITYIRSHNSIPTKSSKDTLVPQVVGSVKDVIAEIEQQYLQGHKDVVLMDYNNIVDILNNESYISELVEKYPDLKVSYGLTTLLKHNGKYSELNIVLPAESPKEELEELSRLLTLSSKKDFIESNGELKLKGGKTLKAPNIDSQELSEILGDTNLIFTLGSYAGILNSMIIDGDSDEAIINYLNTLPQNIKDTIMFEFFEDSAIVETRKTNILNSLDFKPKLIYSNPILHSEGKSILHENRVKALSHSSYNKDVLGIDISKSTATYENTESVLKGNLSIHHQKNGINDYVHLDVEEKWDAELYAELRDESYIEEKNFKDLPLTLEALKSKGDIKTGTYKDDASLESIQRDILIKRSMKGLKKRLKDNGTPEDIHAKYISRMDKEMKTLVGMGFDSYMLGVQGFIKILKERLDAEVGPGRGSAAGSLVAYTLGITNVDPIEHDLLFERFLNEERVSMPDIDVDMQGNQLTINKILKMDFPQEFKDLVVKKFSDATTDTGDYDETIPAKDLLTYWQKSRFGVEAVKNVLTKGTYGAKRAIETICKNYGNEFALSVNPNYGNYGGQAYIHLATDIKGSFFEKVGSNIDSALETEEFQAVYELSPAYSMIIDEARDLEGSLMSFGVHASAEVKTIKTEQKPLSWQQDTAMNIDNTVVTGFDMKKLEPFQKDGQFMEGVGLKDDCLGLKTLNTIRDTMDIVRKVDSTELSQDIYVKSDYINDAKAFEAIRSGDLEGLFQIESSGMKQLAKKLQPDCFEDVVAMLALYRPGPLESGMVDDFVERKHGRQEIDYFDDSLVGVLEPILKNTYGVIVYQEQVMKIVQEVGGFSLGGADEVRRAMGKKIPEEMKRLKGEFVEGAIKKGYKSQIASDLFDLIVKFAGYGFNKSHSAAYAFVTMQTAYLKAHHPEAFYTAHFLGKSGTIENLETIIPEIEKAGVGIAPPDINISYEKPQLRNGKVNYGLDTIKGTRTADIKTIIKSREENGNFKDLKDLMERDGVNVSKATFEGLTKSGALDNLPLDSEGLLSSDQENQSSVSKRASLLAWHAKSQLVKEPTKTQQKKMDEDFENNKLLSTAQKSEFDILGSIVSGVDRKLLNPISLEEVKDILPGEETGSRKIRGDATIIELVSGTNKFGNFYKIRLLDKNNRQQTVTMSKNQISTMKKKGVVLKEGDAVEVTLNKSINIENDTVHVNLKDIVLYNENDEFNRQEILGADVFSVEDLDWSELPKKASNPISLTDLDERVKERGSYPNGKKSQEFTYFLKGFQQTAKKTGYLLEVSDGENTTKVFVSGVSNIDEKLYAKNLNLPITMNFNRYESDFIMTAFNSKPKIHGIKALNPEALKRERDYLSALGVIDDDFDSLKDENQEMIDGIKYPISFSAETRNGVQIFNRDPIKNIMKTGSTKCAMYSAADGETKLWINKVDAESAMVHFAQKDTGAKKSYSRAEQKGKPGITMRGFSAEDEAAVIEGVKSIKQVYYSNFVFTYGEKGAKEVIEILEARGFKDSTGMDIEPLDPPREIELMEPCKYSNSPKKPNKTNTQGNTRNNPKK